MPRSRQFMPVCLFGLVGMLSAGCVAPAASTDSGGPEAGQTTQPGSTVAPRTTGVPTMRPTSAEALGIVLDGDGRPFDNYWGPQGTTTETRLLTRLQIDDGRLEVIDGDAFYQQVLVTIEDTETVRLRFADDLDLRIVWQQRPTDQDPVVDDRPDGIQPTGRSGRRGRPAAAPRWYPPGDGGDSADGRAEYGRADGPDGSLVESILGVRVAVPGSTVARWGRFEAAYETEEGLGAVTSRAVLDWAAGNLEFGEPLLIDGLPADRPYLLADLDGRAGSDLFVFDNGGGEGSYRLTEGFDADDLLVAVMLWDARYPWRLAVPDGTPPPDVTAREQELMDCIEGRRLIDKWGRCT